MSRKSLIIGATSSLSCALAHQLAKAGDNLLLVARDKEELEILASDIAIRYGGVVTTIIVDFTDPGFDPKAFVEQAGLCDAVFMIAGNMGSSDMNDPENIQQIIQVNFTVPAEILTCYAAQMEQQGHGNLVVISSVAGDRGRQSNYPYGSAKAGLTAFSSGLRNRLSDSNIHVMTVKPGFIDTPMTYGMQSPLIASRKNVARSIITAMEKGKDIVYVPFFWRYIMMIINHIPEKIFKKLKL